MRISSTLFCCTFGGLTLAILSCGAWLYLDEQGLPDVRSMQGLAEPGNPPPDFECLISHPVILSYESLGANARYALGAAEYRVNESSGRAAASGHYDAWSSALMLSRLFLCADERPLHRNIDEIRMAIQLKLRYSRKELFTMVANSAFFGDRIVGFEAASLHFFHKHSNELSIQEAALLAGLISRPSYYSPRAHPDRALIRRNQVIDKMVQRGVITAADGLAAKSAPALIASE